MKVTVTVQKDYDDFSIKSFTDPEKAIKQWLIWNSEVPTMADLQCSSEDSVILCKWCKDNRSKILAMLENKKVNTSLDPSIFMREVERCHPHSGMSVDSFYPFCLG